MRGVTLPNGSHLAVCITLQIGSAWAVWNTLYKLVVTWLCVLPYKFIVTWLCALQTGSHLAICITLKLVIT